MQKCKTRTQTRVLLPDSARSKQQRSGGSGYSRSGRVFPPAGARHPAGVPTSHQTIAALLFDDLLACRLIGHERRRHLLPSAAGAAAHAQVEFASKGPSCKPRGIGLKDATKSVQKHARSGAPRVRWSIESVNIRAKIGRFEARKGSRATDDGRGNPILDIPLS